MTLALWPLCLGSVAGEVWVSPQGDDAHQVSSSKQPWRTLERALSQSNTQIIHLSPGDWRVAKGIRLHARSLKIVGPSADELATITFSRRHSDYSLVEGGSGEVYQTPMDHKPGNVWQSDKRDPWGQWQSLSLMQDSTQVLAEPGRYAWVDGLLYVHPWNNSDPSQVIEIGGPQHGVLSTNSSLDISNLRIRGASKSGLYADSGRVWAEDCMFVNNGFNGLHGVHGASIRAVGCQGLSNGNDGFGLHNKSAGVYIECESRGNADDGFSPHGHSVMVLQKCAAQDNLDRGMVAVGGSTMNISDCQIQRNGGQNISYEGIGTSGLVVDTQIGSPGEGQPNARTIVEALTVYYNVTDQDNQPIEPAHNREARAVVIHSSGHSQRDSAPGR